MANYRKVNGHWEIIPTSVEKDEVNRDQEKQAMNDIAQNLSMNNLKPFIRQDAPADFLLRLVIPRYYNDGGKVSPDVIADILARISEAIGGASTWAGKGYWVGEKILYEDKNIFVETLLKGMTPDRASQIGDYLSSMIADILEQEASLYFLIPTMAKFIEKKDFKQMETEAKDNIKLLNEDEDNYMEQQNNDNNSDENQKRMYS